MWSTMSHLTSRIQNGSICIDLEEDHAIIDVEDFSAFPLLPTPPRSCLHRVVPPVGGKISSWINRNGKDPSVERTGEHCASTGITFKSVIRNLGLATVTKSILTHDNTEAFEAHKFHPLKSIQKELIYSTTWNKMYKTINKTGPMY